MRKYIIEQTDTAQILGSYIAETGEHALEMLAVDAGYDTYDDMPGSRDGIVVREDDDDGRWDDATSVCFGVSLDGEDGEEDLLRLLTNALDSVGLKVSI